MNIYDRLYKKMVFPKIIYDLLDCPGLLRLKEVRMANNPFVAFPSFSTTSRYEHSLGVCYLAGICADKLRLKEKDKLELMIAALYHDVGTPPFAHAMEEVLQVKFGFDHEVNLFNLITGKTDSFDQELAQIFCGSSLKLRSVCQQESAVKLGIDATRIAKIAVGSPDEVLSPILNSKGMDLDNIDNIFRASTAMGILNTDGGELAKTLAKAFVISGDRVTYDWQRYADQILYWQKVRDLQYTAIFKSTEDFAYQTMIKESINKLSIQDESGIKLDKDLWRLTDHVFTYEYLLKHSKSRDIMTRVMLCKPYSCIAVLYISGRNTSKFINTHLSQIEQVASAYYDSVIHPKDEIETPKFHPNVGQPLSIIANFYPDKRKREVDTTAVPGGGDAPSINPESSDAALLGLFTPYAATGYSTKLADNGEKKRVKTVFRKENLEQLICSLEENIFQNYHVSVYRGDVDGKFEEDIEADQLGLFDYNSSKYPLDISSIPWYLATFPAPIPKFLIGLLTESGETVLDPFGGAGTTCYEAIKQNRPFLYNDINPFAAEMVSALVLAVRLTIQAPSCLEDLTNRDIVTLQNVSLWEDEFPYMAEECGMEGALEEALAKRHITSDATYWYHRKTLIELLAIWDLIHDQGENPEICQIRKFAFSNILKETCSQRDHFTYITDNCKPKKLVYISALKAYTTMMQRIGLSTMELSHNYQTLNKDNRLDVIIDRSVIRNGDARDLSWIQDGSVDLVLTSPPYLCAQDYIKTMRLQDLFFHGEDLAQLATSEIGARAKRKGNRNRVVDTFYQDIHVSISEIDRVLKPGKYFCMIIGQGKGKITHGIDTVSAIRKDILDSFSFELFFETVRKISYKAVRIGGVDTETLLIFKKVPK